MRLSKIATLALAGVLTFGSLNAAAANKNTKTKAGLSLKDKYLAAKAAKNKNTMKAAKANSAKRTHKNAPRKHYQTGIASYYANMFNGRKTANGEIFNNAHMTAAHRTLPFGTLLEVTNLRNGRSVIVRVNDRGPYVRPRVIDLSKAAARKIGMQHHGITRVKISVINPGTQVAKASENTEGLYALNSKNKNK